MENRKNIVKNTFEGRLKITGFPSKDSIIEKINLYIDKYKSKEKQKLYDIEKETSNSILLNFHQSTEMANYINTKLTLLKMGNNKYSKMDCHLSTKIIIPNQNQNEKNDKKENNEMGKKTQKSFKEIKIKKIGDFSSIDTKKNPKMNRLLNKSLNFINKNVNRYFSPQSNKMKIYESIFLGGPYLEKRDFERKEAIKNKSQWINKKGFIPYIGKETILKNSHMIKNYINLEPHSNNKYIYRPVERTKWVGKHNFYA